MDVILQPLKTEEKLRSLATTPLNNANSRDEYFELSLRLRVSEIAIKGMINVVYLITQLVILSPLSMITLGSIRPLEDCLESIIDRARGEITLIAISRFGFRDLTDIRKIFIEADRQADARFCKMIRAFEKSLPIEAHNIQREREAHAMRLIQLISPEDFFHKKVQIFSQERKALVGELQKNYPSLPQQKYQALRETKQRITQITQMQLSELKITPFTLQEVNSTYSSLANLKAEESLNRIKSFILKTWNESVMEHPNFQRERYANHFFIRKQNLEDSIQGRLTVLHHTKARRVEYESFIGFLSENENSWIREAKEEADRCIMHVGDT